MINFLWYIDILPAVSHIANCQITVSQYRIGAECVFPMGADFQVIAQSGVQERVHRLYVNQTLPGQTSASVEVEESGVYLVSILPIIEGRGITGSHVEYSEVVVVDGIGLFAPTNSTVVTPPGTVAVLLVGMSNTRHHFFQCVLP